MCIAAVPVLAPSSRSAFLARVRAGRSWRRVRGDCAAPGRRRVAPLPHRCKRRWRPRRASSSKSRLAVSPPSPPLFGPPQTPSLHLVHRSSAFALIAGARCVRKKPRDAFGCLLRGCNKKNLKSTILVRVLSPHFCTRKMVYIVITCVPKFGHQRVIIRFLFQI